MKAVQKVAKRHRTSSRKRSLTIEELERRWLFNSVTVVTHGYEPFLSAPAWLSAYGSAIAADAGPGTSIYTLTVGTDSSGNLTVTNFSLKSGPASTDAATSNGNTVVLLDWSAVSNVSIFSDTSDFSTAAVAALVTPYFTSTFPTIGINEPLAEGSIHLIGHSRGASLVSQLATDLGTNGVWVDQLTTLDPVPVPPDPAVTIPANVIFADNYFETQSLTPGTAIAGALNVGPLSLGGAYSLLGAAQHQDVELLYYGTIDTSANANDGAFTVPASYYPNNGLNRLTTGFYYSSIDGGIRPAVGVGVPFGGTGVRSSFTLAGFQWPNVGQLSVPLDTIFLGQSFNVSYDYMDVAGSTSIQWYLDTDQNPYNSGGVLLGSSGSLAETGANVVSGTQNLSTSVAAGNYYLEAKITNGDATRYAYSTLLSVQAPPVIGIKEGGVAIAPGDTTPSTTDGTDFGSLTPGQKSITETFTITNTGLGPLHFLGVTPIIITGTNAKNFIVTQPLTVDASTSTFTITYDPTTLNLSTAMIQVSSNDPTNSNYTFVVNGTDPPYVDFSVTLGTTHLPASTISGNGALLTLPLTVKNLGNSPVAANAALTTVAIYAVNKADNSQTLVTTVPNVNLRGLGSNLSKLLTVSAVLPLGFATGNYTFEAILNPDQAIVEIPSTLTNNTVTTTQSVSVVAGFNDLTGYIASTTVPTSIVSGTAIAKTVSIVVHNLGNVALAATQTVTFTVEAVPTGGGDPIVLTTFTNYLVGAIAAGGTKPITFTTKSAGLPTGTYDLDVQMTPPPAFIETNTANDLLTGNVPIPITAAPPFVDLSLGLGATKFPVAGVISGNGVSLVIPATITNLGNILVPTNTPLDEFTVFAHNTADNDDIADVQVGTLSGINLRGLAIGGVHPLTLTVLLPAGFAAGNYTFHVELNPESETVGSPTANNEATTTQSVSVTQGFYNVEGTLGTTTLPSAVVNDTAISKTVNVIISNLGNLNLPATQKVTITVTATNTDPSENAQPIVFNAGSFLVGALPANGKSPRTLSIPVKYPAGLDSGQYSLSVQITPIALANDTATVNAAGTLLLTSAPPFVDLSLGLGATKFPAASIISGNGTKLVIPATITNLGNILVPTNTPLDDLTIFAHNTVDNDDSADVQIGTLSGINLRGLAINGAHPLSLTALLPVGFPTGNYTFRIVLNPESESAGSSAADNTATTTQSVSVTQGFYGISAALGTTILPPAVVNDTAISKTVNVIVSNLGNLPLPATQQVAVTVTATNTDPSANAAPITINAGNFSIAALQAAGKLPRTLIVPVKLPAGLDTGQYQLNVQLTPLATPVLTGDTGPVTATGTLLLTSGPKFVDLGGTLTATSLVQASVPAGTALNGTVSVKVENLGNSSLPLGQSMTLQVIAHDTDTDADTPLMALPLKESVSLWASGQTVTYVLTFHDTAGLTADQYDLEVQIVPTPTLNEFNTANDTVNLTANGDPISVTVI